MSEEQLTAEEASANAVHAATAHAEAIEKARTLGMSDYFTKQETLDQHAEMVATLTRKIEEMHSALDKKSDQILNVFNVVSTTLKWTDVSTDWISKYIRRFYPILACIVILWLFFKFGWVALVHMITHNFLT